MDGIQFYGNYCDDIRHEVSGKTTLIGCYGPALFVRKLPIKLPKLCFHFTICAPIDNAIETAEITMTQNDQVILKVDGQINMPADSEIEETDTMVSITGGFDMPSFTVEEPALLQTKILINGKEYFGKIIIELKVLF